MATLGACYIARAWYASDMRYSVRQIVGSIIWWTEGTKAYKDKRWKNVWVSHVDVTNTNPEIIKSFLEFLRNDIGIEEQRLKLQLQIHEGDDRDDLESYWSKETKIPKGRFTKTIVRPKGNKHGKSKGTCKVRYSDKETYNKIKKLTQEILSSIVKG
ncbi:MAG: hypothetical protein Q8P49_02290 [Candidatus Liptonbacteria bacterium]|nr:hypothetical protein [Candidatus Liptonbacteria bacterium]